MCFSYRKIIIKLINEIGVMGSHLRGCYNERVFNTLVRRYNR